MTGEIKQPYMGVSGVISPDIESTLEAMAVTHDLTGVNRALALGVKAVHKTQFLDIENKYGSDWYPVGETSFKHALRHDAKNPNTIAVAQTYFDLEYVHDEDYRAQFLGRIVQRGEPWLEAVQFDMLPWHANADMWDFLDDVKQQGLAVFLQAHGKAMAELGPQGAASLLSDHEDLVDYVLFDSSHGTGKRLDVSALEPFIAEAYDQLDSAQTGVAIAGGLHGQIVKEDLPQLLRTYPHLSWDAEGQLHPVTAAGKRPLDLAITDSYLQASADILHNIA